MKRVRRRWSHFSSIRRYCLIAVLCLVCPVLFLYHHQSSDLEGRKVRLEAVYREWKDQFVINTPGCSLPYADPQNEIIMRDWFYRPKKVCGEKRHIFGTRITGDRTCPTLYEEILWQDYEALPNELSCEYWAVRSNTADGFRMNQFTFSESKYLPIGGCIDDELIWIRCRIGEMNYEQPLFNVAKRKFKGDTENKKHAQDKWNVFVFGIDSLSRLAFHRTMKSTMRTLNEIYGENAFELKAFHKVGKNSAPNQIPFLTGKSFHHETDMNNGEYFDDFGRFIWQDYADNGYVTLFAEEQMNYGLFTYVNRNGFRKIPTDYWPRPLMLVRDKRRMSILSPNSLCFGGETASAALLRYWSDLQSVVSQPLFSYVWLSEATHDNVIGGYDIDEDVANFFKDTKLRGLVNKTVILFLADHGYRVEPYRGTSLGRLEDSLPFAFVLLPPSFREKHPTSVKNLEQNTERLVSSFDIHATLLDLLNVGSSNQQNQTEQLGESLFSSVFSPNRTCESCHIDTQHCACFLQTSNEVTNLPKDQLANIVVDEINGLLEKSKASGCIHFKNPKVASLTSLRTKNQPDVFFKLVVEMPSLPVKFEGFFKEINDTFVLQGLPERLDRYSESSKCARDKVYQRYCYCV